MSWTDVGALSDIPVRGARTVKTATGCVVIFRTADEEVFATASACAVSTRTATKASMAARRSMSAL